MRAAAVVAGAVAAALALASCGTETQAQAVRGWMSSANFTANTATLHDDLAHASTALADGTAPATELHTVCAILTTDAEAANSALPTPNDVGLTELSTAYEEMGTASNTCYGAFRRPGARRLAIAQMGTANQDLDLATWQVLVGAAATTDAAATAAWSTETAYPAFARATTAAIDRILGTLRSRATPVADGASCRTHEVAVGAPARLLPTPDSQATSEIGVALRTLATGLGLCASISAATMGPTGPVIATAIFDLTRAVQDLYFASQRVQIASQ